MLPYFIIYLLFIIVVIVLGDKASFKEKRKVIDKPPATTLRVLNNFTANCRPELFPKVFNLLNMNHEKITFRWQNNSKLFCFFFDSIYSKPGFNQAHAECPQVLWIKPLSHAACSRGACRFLTLSVWSFRVRRHLPFVRLPLSVLRLQVWVGKSKVEVAAFMFDRRLEPRPRTIGCCSWPRPLWMSRSSGYTENARTPLKFHEWHFLPQKHFVFSSNDSGDNWRVLSFNFHHTQFHPSTL